MDQIARRIQSGYGCCWVAAAIWTVHKEQSKGAWVQSGIDRLTDTAAEPERMVFKRRFRYTNEQAVEQMKADDFVRLH